MLLPRLRVTGAQTAPVLAMVKFSGQLATYPARAVFVAYASLILAGTALLLLPVCRAPGAQPHSITDALFTATSATCVTGLTVRSTGSDFSLLGQAVILVLIQVGGIGIMTLTTFFTLQVTGRSDLHDRLIVSETLGAGSERNLRWVLRNILLVTAICEGAGFLVLLGRNLLEMEAGEALWSAAFHSVSAFCNAGFALADNSLSPFRDDVVLNLSIAGLIVTGGIGFPVLLDLARNRRQPWLEQPRHWKLHTKLMLIGTTLLLLLGTLAFLALEWNNALAEMTWGQRLLTSFFQSVTVRTAGFNTVPIGTLTNASLFVLILLMTVGAGPCSAGGGLKVSTFMVLVLSSWSRFRGAEQLTLFRRTVPASLVGRATAAALIFGVIAALSLTLLLVLEHTVQPRLEMGGIFLDSMFEVVSALGTVGLSTGLTGQLTERGRLLIVVVMLIGRLGPITVFVAASSGARRRQLHYPREEVLIG